MVLFAAFWLPFGPQRRARMQAFQGERSPEQTRKMFLGSRPRAPKPRPRYHSAPKWTPLGDGHLKASTFDPLDGPFCSILAPFWPPKASQNASFPRRKTPRTDLKMFLGSRPRAPKPRPRYHSAPKWTPLGEGHLKASTFDPLDGPFCSILAPFWPQKASQNASFPRRKTPRTDQKKVSWLAPACSKADAPVCPCSKAEASICFSPQMDPLGGRDTSRPQHLIP